MPRIKVTKDKGLETAKELKTVRTDEEVNDLIKKGWEIVGLGSEHLDSNGFNVKRFVMMVRK